MSNWNEIKAHKSFSKSLDIHAPNAASRLTNDNWYQLFSSPVWFAIKCTARRKIAEKTASIYARSTDDWLPGVQVEVEKKNSNWMERMSNMLFITWSTPGCTTEFQSTSAQCTFIIGRMNYGHDMGGKVRSVARVILHNDEEKSGLI